MIRAELKSLAPAALMALGILVATAVAKATVEAGWLVLAGPLTLALFAAAAAGLVRIQERGGAESLIMAAILLLALMIAGLLMAAGDPALVPAMMPVLGGGVAFPIVVGRRRAFRRCSARWWA